MNKKITFSKLIIGFFISLYSLVCFLPMVLMLIVSFTDERSIDKFGYSFIPRKWSVEAYNMIFSNGSQVLNAYGVSIIVTVLGTLLAAVITAAAAYTLANKNVRYRNGLALFFFIPMVFTSGMVPWYLMCRQLGLTNNIFALIIPSLLFSPFNLFLVRNFMAGIPDALRESAMIDGANDITIAFRIYLPLCVPVLATITLFYGLAYWNDWWNAIMLVSNEKLYPLQYLLLEMKSRISMVNAFSGGSTVASPTESVKMATSVVTIGPIIFLYPLLQRYFVKGLIIGSVKG